MNFRYFLLSLLGHCVMLPSMLMASSASLVVDHATGLILHREGIDEGRQVASLTKIASALVLLEWIESASIDPATTFVTVPAEAIRGGANPLGLHAGDEISILTGLQAAMMASDNTSTHALAVAAGAAFDPSASDRIAAFVARMNGLARRLGMDGTHFVNPHGLDEGGELGVSTATDIARLALAAHDRVDFNRLCMSQEEVVIVRRGSTQREVKLVNTNELLGSRGIDGTKTGTTRRSGPCLVVSATRTIAPGGVAQERRLVAVLLNSGDRFRDAVLILDQGWQKCEAWLAEGAPIDPNRCLRNAAK